ncbi:dTDP-4-dehydrorhamnose reductase [Dyella ginsengisoli]|uniref:dTDP-4-dehydrorhamnose reductase n=1 Tax=Dyella ginsengisoli TaxID=363848 RepID=UPI0003818B9F|nr:dTDP-4-dehydrorhamnose reductase [Dyella ginsengisoli]
MKTLLLGANGQLGRSFVEDGRLARMGTLVSASRDGQRFDGTSIETIDLAFPDKLYAALDMIAPDVIVNAAAYTAVDRAEQEEVLATRVNGEAVNRLGLWAQRHGALVVHFSTDYVFDGSSRQPLRINDPTGPLGAYGRSKLAGEQALQASGAGYLIFRTAWVYAAHGHNFLRTMLRLGGEQDSLGVVADQHGTPTSTDVIVDGTLVALEAWLAADDTGRKSIGGIYHLVASGYTTWHGFAEAIFAKASQYGLLARVPEVLAIDTTQFSTLADRPVWSVLENRDMAEKFGYQPPDWREALTAVIKRLATSRST